MVNGRLVLLRVMAVLGHVQDQKLLLHQMAVLHVVDQQPRQNLATLKHVQVAKH